jgi:hypothetical protein
MEEGASIQIDQLAIETRDEASETGVTKEAVENTPVIPEATENRTPPCIIEEAVETTPVILDNAEAGNTSESPNKDNSTREMTPCMSDLDSRSTENEFPSAILLSENIIRSEDDYDMLEGITIVMREDVTNGAAQDSLDEIIIYEIMSAS